jgi:sigma-B regulation protein RsbU (phosphoserine phosphatase)
VLALVLDSAIEVGGAERGFIMLAGAESNLEFKLARGRGRATLSGVTFATSQKIPEEVFRTGESRHVADLLDGDLANVHMGTVQLGIRHVLCVPLRLVRYIERAAAPGEEKRIGVLYLDSKEKGTLLSNTTRGALETLATEAAVAIENARLYDEILKREERLARELSIARKVQHGLFPDCCPSGPGFEASAHFLPASELGGDLYDFYEMGEGVLGVSLGDVAGKGVPAALYGAFASGSVRARAFARHPPADLLARVNRTLRRRGVEGLYCTLIFALFDFPARRVRLANSGLPYAFHFRAATGRCEAIELPGLPLGTFDGSIYDERTLELAGGDVFVFHTDGITEARGSEEEYGMERLRQRVETGAELSAPLLGESILQDVNEFTGARAPDDDLTLVIVKIL